MTIIIMLSSSLLRALRCRCISHDDAHRLSFTGCGAKANLLHRHQWHQRCPRVQPAGIIDSPVIF
jgi:hypothetical protein